MPSTAARPTLPERIVHLWEKRDTPEAKQLMRYTMVSVISTGVSFAVLGLVFGVFHIWGEVGSTLFANIVASVPSYFLTRRWVWGKSGRSHLVKEIIPFWAMSALGVAFSIVGASVAKHLGQHFGLDLPQNADTFRIVGIVRDAKFAGWGLRRPAMPMFYVPLAQNVNYKDELMKRVEVQSHFIEGIMLVTGVPPGALEPELTRTLAGLDPSLTIVSVRTMEERVALTFDQERAVATLAELFGTVALLLAAVGLYGVTAYTVAQRTNEIGIRMALGADRAEVVRHVLRGAFTRVAIGLGLGLPLSVAAGRLISSQLYDVSFWDPLALAVAASALGLCALIAALVPANAAASISPMTALRAE